MEMFNTWVRLKLWEPEKSNLVFLDGQTTKDVNAEDAFFEVIETGPDVTRVGVGDIMVCSFVQGMFRFKLPNETFKSFALPESEFLGCVKRGSVQDVGNRPSNEETGTKEIIVDRP